MPHRDRYEVMMSRVAVPAVLVLAVLVFAPRSAAAKPEYTRRTKKECSYCHPKDSFNLNEAGKYYRDHNHSLEGFKPSPSH